MNQQNDLQKKNKRVLLYVMLFVGFMVGLAFAAVPLYDLFCRVTGFDGTTMRSDQAPTEVSDRIMQVMFNTDVHQDLPWTFVPEQRQHRVRIGEKAVIVYKATNTSDKPVAGTAVYNVTPSRMGQYFYKIQCFCFEDQIIQPGETVNMPVMYYLDPAILDDKNMFNTHAVTLSYTFFASASDALDSALSQYGNRPAYEQSPMAGEKIIPTTRQSAE